MEPNGGALISKLRRVALSLLDDPPDRKGAFGLKADEALAQLVDSLTKLSSHTAAAAAATATTTTMNDQPLMMTSDDELDELRHWAELRDFQLRFAAGMGFADLVGG
ncbi:fungal transcriptional regulatory protein [Ophiocordyceps camponoti-floridani]|uniref:Fungal transcriptional regulatory protein n=1 Tax=Ophiocordyceps camponoti-floridani TaxID=2030778 RepID=A0A8H4Q2B4_9HYPO|nr:fungal transcriptional regulatory protein [Ophiocordyceps camponoti-floridani]